MKLNEIEWNWINQIGWNRCSDAVDAADVVEVKPEVDLPSLWFSLIPRTPCDEDSLTSASTSNVLSNGVADATATAASRNEDAQHLQQLQQVANEEVDKREIQPLPEGPNS